MCRAAQCSACLKTTWTGCGQHVSEVMRNIPEAQRCQCKKQQAKERPPQLKNVNRFHQYR